MPHHHARLIVVAVAAVSFSTPITAQQEPTSPPTLEALVETLGGRVSQNEQGEVVEVRLSRTAVTDAALAHLTGLTALEELDLWGTPITDAGLAHLAGLPALQSLFLYNTEVTAAGLVHFQKMPALSWLELNGGYFSSGLFTEEDIVNLREALPNVQIEDGAPVAPPPPPPSPARAPLDQTPESSRPSQPPSESPGHPRARRVAELASLTLREASPTGCRGGTSSSRSSWFGTTYPSKCRCPTTQRRVRPASNFIVCASSGAGGR